MKHLQNILTAAVFASLIIFTNCGSDGGGGKKDPAAREVGDALAGTWSVSSAMLDSSPRDEWADFTMTVSLSDAAKAENGGTYSITNLPPDEGSDLVFKTGGGVWNFVDTKVPESGITIDGRATSFSVGATSLTVTFTVAEAVRAEGFVGEWSFTFTK